LPGHLQTMCSVTIREAHQIGLRKVGLHEFISASTVRHCSHFIVACPGALQVGRVFDIPDRPSSRPNRFDVMPARGNEVLELAAASTEETTSWLHALSVTAHMTDVRQHPRAAELLQ
jgi:hypothetical protein